MATTKTSPPTKPRGAARKPAGSLGRLEHALEDLDEARKDAGHEARERIDAAVDCVRDAARSFRGRTEERMSEWQRMLENETDEAIVELGRMAVRAQRTPAGLREMSAEIRKRRAELSPPKPKQAA